MEKVISTENKPIKLWLDDIEEGALQQAKNIANLPFVYKHVALMPDCHQGYGMPIGGVLATENVVVPNAVGVDIGCGMCALRTSIKNINKKQLIKIRDNITKNIPVGFNKHKTKQKDWLKQKEVDLLSGSVIEKHYQSSLYQLGTLGGGNHFIEIQKGSDDYVWIMIHSGSRNLGKQVADFYNKTAINLNKRWFSEVKKEQQLAFLPIETEEAKDYMKEMQYCVDFAFVNRTLMMENVKDAFFSINKNVNFDKFINIAHNYARFENHFNKNVIVHRKGATSAKKKETGIIPGSQGSKSYIVEGLGNEQSFKSCSHGAGRKMGRNQAIKKLSLKVEIDKMKRLGVIHNIKSEKDLDEAAGAYKNIDTVMGNQKDLVKILVELTPLAVVKG